VRAELTRPGRKVRLAKVTITANGIEIARAAALQIRRGDLQAPPNEPDPPPPGPADLEDWGEGWAGRGAYFHSEGVELRPLPQADPRRPKTVWIRLRTHPIAGHPTSPLSRILAAADFPNGVSLRLDPTRFASINPELTVHIQREPQGEWVCVDAETYLEPDGTGLAEAVLYDERGRLGRATQALIVESR
jgi:acyl-CoA thioesterase